MHERDVVEWDSAFGTTLHSHHERVDLVVRMVWVYPVHIWYHYRSLFVTSQPG